MIDKRFSEKHGRKMWGYDIRVSNGQGGKRRVRQYECETRDEAERIVAAIRRAERESRYGVAPAMNRPRLHDLIDKRIPTIAMRAERTRARRILYTWLSLLDPKIKLGKKYEPEEPYRSPFKVDEVKTGTVRIYVEKRQAD
jgi:hypothetical protein